MPYKVVNKEPPLFSLEIVHFTHVIPSIANRIHRVRGHFENTIESEGLINEEEEVTPIYSSRKSLV